MSDPTAQEFIDAMTVLKRYTGESQICLEGDSLIASVDGLVLTEDQKRLEELGWVLKDNGRDVYYKRSFQDH